jgi:hypothetical protein
MAYDFPNSIPCPSCGSIVSFAEQLAAVTAARDARVAEMEVLLRSARLSIMAAIEQPGGEHRRAHRLNLLQDIDAALSARRTP